MSVSSNSKLSSLLSLNSLTEQDQSIGANTKYTQQQSSYAATPISPSEGIKVYIKAVLKLKSMVKRSTMPAKEYLKLKQSKNAQDVDASKKKYLVFTQQIIKTQDIVNEFLRGFSVLHEQDQLAQDFMRMIFERFQYLSDKINLYHIFAKDEYRNDINEMLDRLQSTFEKMLEYVKTEEGQQ